MVVATYTNVCMRVARREGWVAVSQTYYRFGYENDIFFALGIWIYTFFKLYIQLFSQLLNNLDWRFSKIGCFFLTLNIYTLKKNLQFGWAFHKLQIAKIVTI